MILRRLLPAVVVLTFLLPGVGPAPAGAATGLLSDRSHGYVAVVQPAAKYLTLHLDKRYGGGDPLFQLLCGQQKGGHRHTVSQVAAITPTRTLHSGLLHWRPSMRYCVLTATARFGNGTAVPVASFHLHHRG